MIQKRATSVAFFILSIFVLSQARVGLAQEAVYRCGHEYTNDAKRAKQEKCRLLDSGGAVVTIPSDKRAIAVTRNTRPSALAAPAKTSSAVQQQRDSDAKTVIEAELKKTEAQMIDLRKQYNQLSAQTDVERKLAVKKQIDRGEADIASLKRELKQ